ncbi:hypothetical protein NDU88_004681 [Pleurodeles waltl]|uniref:Uncharacterized protein n=1 Tax=Pleurodeles waltl TaxID=8319 RepID=A0AAV7PI84_PLEWA|nr:hypothetical protein NDU88_004681 [Pleurodeles waltl]
MRPGLLGEAFSRIGAFAGHSRIGVPCTPFPPIGFGARTWRRRTSADSLRLRMLSYPSQSLLYDSGSGKARGRPPVEMVWSPQPRPGKRDYSGTNLMSTVEAHTFEAQDYAAKRVDELVCESAPNIGDRHTDSEMLQSVYDLIKELQTETRAESRRARMATKHLQGTVRKVVKSCAEIEGKLSSMEERTMAVEGETEALRAQTTTHGQLTDIMWKLEDQENR